MPGFVFPEAVIVRLLSEDRTPFRAADVIIGIQTSKCHKNPYHLGPFFSDADGIVTITRAMLESAVSDELSTGIMDYGAIQQCGPEVTIRPWTAAETTGAVRIRRKVWTSFLPGEAQQYRSIEELIDRLARATNHRLRVADEGVRDRWDGSRSRFEYEYVVYPKAPRDEISKFLAISWGTIRKWMRRGTG
jgi:hypothetical protein